MVPSSSNYAKASIFNGKLGGGRATSKSGAAHKQFIVNDDTAQFYFKSNGSGNYYGYYATVTADGYDSYDAASGTYEDPVPNNSQNSFLGWYADNSYTTKINNPYSLKADTTVYAKISKYTNEGMWGTCPWGITKDGVLEIGTGTGAEQTWTTSPWKAYSDKITAIKAIGAVKAPANCRCLFNGLSKATSADLKNFDTSSVTDMSRMFENCSSLTSLDVSNWDTGKVTDMSRMFWNCSSLTSLDLSNWNTGSVTYMGSMFQNCSGLTSLDVSKWDTGSVTNMNATFEGCSNLATLDVSGWDTGSVKNMEEMFADCSILRTIYVGSKWNANNAFGFYMFLLDTNLAGGAGTKYDASHTNTRYAHVDGGTSNPGYLTAK